MYHDDVSPDRSVKGPSVRTAWVRRWSTRAGGGDGFIDQRVPQARPWAAEKRGLGLGVPSPVMEFVFVRHGQPQWSVDGMSRPDPVLTELGRDQAKHTAQRLAAERRPITEILVSPATRSQQTAAPLAEATGIVPITVDDLLEIQMPDWENTPEETVQKLFSEARERPPEEWWDGLSGGESFRHFHNRVTGGIQTILAERGISPDALQRPHLWDHAGGEGRIAIVAHGGTNSVALTFLLGVEPTPWEWERFLLAHASIARVRAIPLAGAHVFSLRAFNDQEHLPTDKRSV